MDNRPKRPILAHILQRFIVGLLLFIPVFVLTLGLFHTYKLGQKIAVPLQEMIGVDTLIGLIALNAAAVLFVVLLIYVFGYLAELPFIMRKINRLDRALSTMIPGYIVAKSIVGGVVRDDDLLSGMRPVLVQTIDGQRVGFETERTEGGLVTVFLPNAPTASTGISLAVAATQVTPMDIPPHRVIELLSFHGRGMSAQIERQIPRPNDHATVGSSSVRICAPCSRERCTGHLSAISSRRTRCSPLRSP